MTVFRSAATLKGMKKTLLVLFFGALFSTGARSATELARINQTVISLEEFNKRYQENLKYFQLKAPTRRSVLEDMVRREIAIQEARKLGLDKDPDVLDKMNTVLYHSLIEKRLSKEFEKIQITDAEAKAFYAKFPEIRTSHIFVAVRPDAPAAEDKAAAERIRKIYTEEVRPGKLSFAEIAQRFSEGIAAPMGGDIDYQTKDKLDPTYYQTALGLGTPGKISGIVKSQFGYHIIKLTAIRPWEEADHPAIKRLVFEQRRSEVFDRYMAGLRAQAKVSMKPELLKE